MKSLFSFSTAKTEKNSWGKLGETKLVVWWFDVTNKIYAEVEMLRQNTKKSLFQEMYKSQAKNLEIEMNQMISQLKELQDNLEKECLARKESENLVKVYESKFFDLENERKDYQSQVEHLQKKYDNEVVAHQKSDE